MTVGAIIKFVVPILAVSAFFGLSAGCWSRRLYLSGGDESRAGKGWYLFCMMFVTLPALVLGWIGGADWLLVILAFWIILSALALSDIASMRAPFWVSGVLVFAGLGVSALVSKAVLVESSVAAIVTYIVFHLIKRGYLDARGKPGMGGGDPLAAAGLGAWLGAATPYALVIAAALALLFALVRRSMDAPVAFVPFLALAGFIIMTSVLILFDQPVGPGTAFSQGR